MKSPAPSTTLLFTLLLAATAFLSSCSPFRNLPLADARALKGKTVARVVRPPARVQIVTPGIAIAQGMAAGLGGAVGGAMAASAGDGSGDIAARNGIEDPARTGGRELAADLVKRHGMKKGPEIHTRSGRVSTLAKEGSGADYLLDVQTLGWVFQFFPLAPGTYRTIHTSRMRLIDCKAGKVVAEGYLTREPDEPNWYSYEGLTGNGAAGIRKESELSGEAANDHYRSLLKL